MIGHVMDARDLSMSQRQCRKKNLKRQYGLIIMKRIWCEQLKYGWCDHKDPFSKHQIQRIYSANAEVLQ